MHKIMATTPTIKKEAKLGNKVNPTQRKLTNSQRSNSIAMYRGGVRGQIVWDCETSEQVEEEGGDEEEFPAGSDAEQGEKDEDEAEGDGEGEEEGEGDGGGDGEGDGEEGEDDGFDDEENSCLELYFQPKWQTADRTFYFRCVLEVLQAILDDEMYKQLRTIEQLGYNVSCQRKSTGGVVGISFIVQSAVHDPIYCQGKIIEFLDDFYHDKFNEEMFSKYKAGVIARKTKGYDGMLDEAEDVFLRMVNFSQEAMQEPDWDRREYEVAILKHLTLGEVKKYYKAFFAPKPPVTKQGDEGIVQEDYDLYRSFTKRIAETEKVKIDQELPFEHFMDLLKGSNLKKPKMSLEEL